MSVVKIKDFDIMSYNDESITFVLDTNVVYSLHSGYFLNCEKGSREYKTFKDFSFLINSLIRNKRHVVVCSLSLEELIHLVSNKEYYTYLSKNRLKKEDYSIKKFRKNSVERERLQRKLQVVISEIKIAYSIDDACVSCNDIESFVDEFNTHRYDGIDYLIVKNTDAEEGNLFYITSDKDFQADKNINVITT